MLASRFCRSIGTLNDYVDIVNMTYTLNPAIRFLSIGIFLAFSCKTSPVSTSSIAFQPDTRFKVVGYLLAGNFDEIDSIEIERITHLCLAFANPDASGKLVMDSEGDMEKVVQKAHKAGVKVLISLAGGGRPDKDIWKKVLSPDSRDMFISSVMEFVEAYSLDGVDVGDGCCQAWRHDEVAQGRPGIDAWLRQSDRPVGARSGSAREIDCRAGRCARQFRRRAS